MNNKFKKFSKVRNKKNGKLYTAYLPYIPNATNGNEHQIMVMYTDDENKPYVRELKEFLHKFSQVSINCDEKHDLG